MARKKPEMGKALDVGRMMAVKALQRKRAAAAKVPPLSPRS
jgi:hypothetical protein